MTTSTSGGSGASSQAGLRAKFVLFTPQAYPRKILGAFDNAHEARQNKTCENVEHDWRIVHSVVPRYATHSCHWICRCT